MKIENFRFSKDGAFSIEPTTAFDLQTGSVNPNSPEFLRFDIALNKIMNGRKVWAGMVE